MIDLTSNDGIKALIVERREREILQAQQGLNDRMIKSIEKIEGRIDRMAGYLTLKAEAKTRVIKSIEKIETRIHTIEELLDKLYDILEDETDNEK